MFLVWLDEHSVAHWQHKSVTVYHVPNWINFHRAIMVITVTTHCFSWLCILCSSYFYDIWELLSVKDHWWTVVLCSLLGLLSTSRFIGTVHYVNKCMSPHKAIVVITKKVHCFSLYHVLHLCYFYEVWPIWVSRIKYDQLPGAPCLACWALVCCVMFTGISNVLLCIMCPNAWTATKIMCHNREGLLFLMILYILCLASDLAKWFSVLISYMKTEEIERWWRGIVCWGGTFFCWEA